MRTDDGAGAPPARAIAPLLVAWLVAAAVAVCGQVVVAITTGVVTLPRPVLEAVAASGGLFVGLVAGGVGAVLLPAHLATRRWTIWMLAGVPGPTAVAVVAAVRIVARAAGAAPGADGDLGAPGGMADSTPGAVIVAGLLAAGTVVGAALGSLLGGLIRRALA